MFSSERTCPSIGSHESQGYRSFHFSYQLMRMGYHVVFHEYIIHADGNNPFAMVYKIKRIEDSVESGGFY